MSNPFVDLCGSISAPDLRETRMTSTKTPGSVRLALVSLEMPELTSHMPGRAERPPEVDPSFRKLWGCRGNHAKTLKSRFQTAMTEAVRRCADIICVNEMGFPSHNYRPYLSTVRWAKKLAHNKNCLLIAGSYHDGETLLNTGHVFYHGCGECGVRFYKQVSATNETADEYVSVPPRRTSVVMQAFGLNVGVVVCLDLADFSTIGGLVRCRERPNVILVSAHTKQIELLGNIAAATSEAINGYVGIVNRYDQASPTRFYKFGALCEIKPEACPGGAEIRFYDIRLVPDPASPPPVPRSGILRLFGLPVAKLPGVG